MEDSIHTMCFCGHNDLALHGKSDFGSTIIQLSTHSESQKVLLFLQFLKQDVHKIIQTKLEK